MPCINKLMFFLHFFNFNPLRASAFLKMGQPDQGPCHTCSASSSPSTPSARPCLRSYPLLLPSFRHWPPSQQSFAAFLRILLRSSCLTSPRSKLLADESAPLQSGASSTPQPRPASGLAPPLWAVS